MFLQVGGGFFDSFLKAQQASSRIANSILNFGWLQLQQEQLKEKQKQAREQAEATKTILGTSVQELQQAKGELAPQAQNALKIFRQLQQDGLTGTEAQTALPVIQKGLQQQQKLEQQRREQEQLVARTRTAISGHDLTPEDEARLIAVQTAPEGTFSTTFKDRLTKRILGPEEGERLNNELKRLNIRQKKRQIQSDEIATDFLRQRGVQLPEGVVLNGAANLVKEITLRDLERPDEIFDRYVKFLTQNDSLQIGFAPGATNIFQDPEAFQTITNAFIELHAPVFGRSEVEAAISTGPLTPPIVAQIGRDIQAGKSEKQILSEIQAAFEARLGPVFRQEDAKKAAAAARAVIKRIQRGTRRP